MSGCVDGWRTGGGGGVKELSYYTDMAEIIPTCLLPNQSPSSSNKNTYFIMETWFVLTFLDMTSVSTHCFLVNVQWPFPSFWCILIWTKIEMLCGVSQWKAMFTKLLSS